MTDARMRWLVWALSNRLCNLYQHARIQRVGQGVWTPPPPPDTSQNIGFFSKTGPNPLNNHKATKSAFNVGPQSMAAFSGIWILEKTLSTLDPLWQNFLDLRMTNLRGGGGDNPYPAEPRFFLLWKHCRSGTAGKWRSHLIRIHNIFHPEWIRNHA